MHTWVCLYQHYAPCQQNALLVAFIYIAICSFCLVIHCHNDLLSQRICVGNEGSTYQYWVCVSVWNKKLVVGLFQAGTTLGWWQSLRGSNFAPTLLAASSGGSIRLALHCHTCTLFDFVVLHAKLLAFGWCNMVHLHSLLTATMTV